MNIFASNKRKRALFALLLSLLLLLGACRAALPGEEETTVPSFEPTSAPVLEGAITVPYTTLDTLNPFTMKTLVNFPLISLMYDGLFRLDGGFTPEPMIAREAALSGEGVKVTLDDSLVFSDASALTSADVVYSFELARKAPLYEESLREFVSCEAQGTFAVTFTLSSPDVNAVSLLTFPVVREGSADVEGAVPVGSGCYYYAEDELRSFLRVNLRHGGGIPRIGTVRLREVSESATLMHVLNTGGIDCFYTDMADGVAKRSYSGANEVYLNNLVFLGVNSASGMLANAQLRQAISAAVSRSAIVTNSFVSHARAAVYPFNTSWAALSSVSGASDLSVDADPAAADALLSALRLGTGRETLTLRLLVRENAGAFLKSAASLIADELSYVNLKVELETCGDETYLRRLRGGDFDLYLGEIKLTKNMDLNPFFTAGGAAAYGIDAENSRCADLYRRYRAGSLELSDFLSAFSRELPFIPLCYRNGQFCYSRAIRSAVQSTEERLFYNIEEWVI